MDLRSSGSVVKASSIGSKVLTGAAAVMCGAPESSDSFNLSLTEVRLDISLRRSILVGVQQERGEGLERNQSSTRPILWIYDLTVSVIIFAFLFTGVQMSQSLLSCSLCFFFIIILIYGCGRFIRSSIRVLSGP